MNKVTRNENYQLHSFNDEPALISDNGTRYWYKDGKCHRDNDLPATIDPDGTHEWFKDGKRHRETDAAIIKPDGYKSYFLNGVMYPFHKWLQLTSLSEEDKVQLVLQNE